MKTGETRYLVKKLNLTKPYDAVRFRLTNTKNTVVKSTDADQEKDRVLESEGVFLIPLQQEDTGKLEGSVTIEAEIDFEDHSVRYSDFDDAYINKSLGWDQIEGSAPSQDDGFDAVMQAIEEGVAILIEPEGARDLIDAVTELFQDTKDIAQSVRDDADAGEFDGFSPQVTVKTETPSTYVLHIKDADHEFDTPNLQGQGGEGSIEVGDGLKRVGNVVSVDNGNYLYFSNGKLTINPVSLGSSKLRQDLADTTITTQYKPLATREYVDNLISTSLKRLVVQTLPQNPNAYTIYMILRSAPTTNNIYDEYMYINNAWELIGSTEVDLSNYYTKTESDSKYQNKLTVGNGIDITSDTISTKISGSFLTFANNGLTINTTVLGSSYALRQELANGDSTTFALASKSNLADYQPKLTAGTNITIDSNNVISASGGGLSYTFTDGLTESSGTVGIDIASGSKLLIDANDKLDVDLSSKQDTIDSNNKLDADLVDDTNSTNKFVSASEKSTWNAKADDTVITTDTTSTTVSLTLADNTEYRYTQDLTSLTLTMPSGDFISSIVFASGSTPTSMTYDSNIKWSGDDVTNGQFVPSADKDYDICLYYNGLNVNGIVRGV